MATVPSRVELVRMITEAGDGLKPEEMLPKIGGAAAVEDLLDLLQNEPDPLTGDKVQVFWLQFRQNVIRLLQALHEERALVPLMECYGTYKLFEDLVVHTLGSQGVAVPPRYNALSLMEDWQKAGSPSLKDSPGYPLFAHKIAASHLEANLGSNVYWVSLMKCSWLVRLEALRAVEQINRAAGRDFFARVLEQERDSSVREGAALALGRLKDPLAIDELRAYLDRKSFAPAQMKEAIDLLAAIPDERARQALRTFYERCTTAQKSEFRLHAGWRLGLNPEPQPSKGGCFIATAAYGSSSDADVLLLREFRDRQLLSYRVGAALVALYQYLSPAVADFIRPRAWCRRAVRFLLIHPIALALCWFHLAEPCATRTCAEEGGTVGEKPQDVTRTRRQP